MGTESNPSGVPGQRITGAIPPPRKTWVCSRAPEAEQCRIDKTASSFAHILPTTSGPGKAVIGCVCVCLSVCLFVCPELFA